MTATTDGTKNTGQRGGGRTPVDSKTRARVRKLARGGMSRNAVAREVGISTYSVSRICAEAKPPITFDRSAIKVATEARQVDLKAARGELATRAVQEARRLFGLMSAEHEVIHWDKDGIMHRGTIDQPTSGDVKNYAIAVGILLDKHVVLTKVDADPTDLPAVDAWLDWMTGGEPA